MGSNLAPDQLNVVSNNAQDPEDPAFTQWTIAGPFSASDGNVVVPYIFGKDAFTDMGKDLAGTSSGDFTYIVGFETTVDVPLGGQTLQQHLTRAAGAGVLIKGLFHADKVLRALGRPFKENGPLNDLINQLGGVSFLDGSVALTSGHHQKIVVCTSGGALVGYCGGVDVAKNRREPDGWHDVHCRITGPAAFDLFATFRDRWAHTGLTLQDPAPAVPGPVGGNLATYRVQIARTHPWGPQLALGVTQNETTAFDMILNAIRKSSTFIYVEDQFLVCNNGVFLRALKDRLSAPSFKFLVMVTCATDKVDGSLQGQAGARRKALLDELRKAAPDKVIASVRKDLYFHAKTWVFDDKFAIIGSANMNNRGYFHDSEVVAGIADNNAGGTRLWFAHRLRMALWMKHLDISEKDALDPTSSVDKWKGTTAKIEPLTPTGTTGVGDDLKWFSVIDPS